MDELKRKILSGEDVGEFIKDINPAETPFMEITEHMFVHSKRTPKAFKTKGVKKDWVS